MNYLPVEGWFYPLSSSCFHSRIPTKWNALSVEFPSGTGLAVLSWLDVFPGKDECLHFHVSEWLKIESFFHNHPSCSQTEPRFVDDE